MNKFHSLQINDENGNVTIYYHLHNSYYRYCIAILLSKSYLSLNADFPNFQRNNQVTQGFWFSPADTNCPSSHESRLLEPKLRWVSQRNPHLIEAKDEPLLIIQCQAMFNHFVYFWFCSFSTGLIRNFRQNEGFLWFIIYSRITKQLKISKAVSFISNFSIKKWIDAYTTYISFLWKNI